MKPAWSQTSQSAFDAALQLRILATGRFHDALTEHTIKARKYFVGLSKTKQRKLAARLGKIEPAGAQSRPMLHLGQIHGDLSHQVANHLSASSSRLRPAARITRDPVQSQPIEYAGSPRIYQGVEW